MQRLVLAVIAAFALFAFVHAETTCESHRRNSQSSAHTLRWNITCDEHGHYDPPLQCTVEAKEEKRWCACYNKEEAITGPSRKTRTCICPLDADEKKDAPQCDIPTCSSNNTGKYEPKQCCASTGMCHCVNPENGQKRTDPTTDANLQCPNQ